MEKANGMEDEEFATISALLDECDRMEDDIDVMGREGRSRHVTRMLEIVRFFVLYNAPGTPVQQTHRQPWYFSNTTTPGSVRKFVSHNI